MLKLTPDDAALLKGLLTSVLESGPANDTPQETAYLARISVLVDRLAPIASYRL